LTLNHPSSVDRNKKGVMTRVWEGEKERADSWAEVMFVLLPCYWYEVFTSIYLISVREPLKYTSRIDTHLNCNMTIDVTVINKISHFMYFYLKSLINFAFMSY